MASIVNEALVTLGVAPKAVAEVARPLAVTSRSLPVGHLGRSYAVRLHAVGGTPPYRWSRTGGTLAGLRLVGDGRLRGVPRRSGSFALRLRVVDRAGKWSARTFRLRIA
jgi:hypothetical protein